MLLITSQIQFQPYQCSLSPLSLKISDLILDLPLFSVFSFQVHPQITSFQFISSNLHVPRGYQSITTHSNVVTDNTLLLSTHISLITTDMSWFPEGFEPYNNETILEPDGRIILLLHNPLVALSLILYTLLIIRLTADLAYECFCGVIEDFTEVCPNVFYYYHLVFNYINPAFWMSLSHAFLLSNWEILVSSIFGFSV